MAGKEKPKKADKKHGPEKPAVKAEKKPEKHAKEEKAARKPESKEKDKGKQAKSVTDPWQVLRFPHLAEKSMNMVEFENKLTFIVNRRSSKLEIKRAVESLFDVKVVRVQTEITTKGVKKAYAKLSPGDSASEIASRLGMV